MFRHYLIAAWRNLASNKLQSAIAIFGLAIGLTAAILAGVVTLDAFSHDHFIPGYDRIYYAVRGTHDRRWRPLRDRDVARPCRLSARFPRG